MDGNQKEPIRFHAKKIGENKFDTNLTGIRKNQFNSMPRRSITMTIPVLKRLVEKYREQKKDLYLVLIYLEMAYDTLPRTIIFYGLKAKDTL